MCKSCATYLLLFICLAYIKISSCINNKLRLLHVKVEISTITWMTLTLRNIEVQELQVPINQET